ncbi:hypothetical protein PsorP6_016441 [Peronosclerospora sorghi]|uniref:Uncharacterized protein n=1 Tax=Peronosclerospora sorghi TaxID=230839 RepID=A0ACC0VLY2_9STRA|nr:hypothetical protein PsorP6_016441 [Peronosclerospora sorghi]
MNEAYHLASGVSFVERNPDDMEITKTAIEDRPYSFSSTFFDAYYTIHNDPKSHCSYKSFELDGFLCFRLSLHNKRDEMIKFNFFSDRNALESVSSCSMLTSTPALRFWCQERPVYDLPYTSDIGGSANWLTTTSDMDNNLYHILNCVG